MKIPAWLVIRIWRRAWVVHLRRPKFVAEFTGKGKIRWFDRPPVDGDEAGSLWCEAAEFYGSHATLSSGTQDQP